MDIILATRNRSKAEQIKGLLEGLPVSILTLAEASIEGQAVEDGTTLEENSLKKARFAWEKTKKWTISEDTGFFIDALGGEPGIHAARWAGPDKSTEEIMEFTLKKLNGVPPEKRTATFRTVATVLSPEGEARVFSGEVHGTILDKGRVAPQPDMPYSSIFVVDGKSVSWAEMSVEEENQVSHRGRAFGAVLEYLKSSISK